MRKGRSHDHHAHIYLQANATANKQTYGKNMLKGKINKS